MGFNLYIYDLSGRLVDNVMETTFSGLGMHRNMIDVSKYTPGTYFCTLDAGGKVISKKFIVQH